MKAVILAAGACARFWPLAQDRHKSLYAVGDGKPLLWSTLSGLAKAGIQEALVVVNARDKAIMEAWSDRGSLGVKIGYAIQSDPLGMGDGILRAKEFLAPEENFLVINASQVNAGEVLKRERRSLKLLNDRIILFGQPTTASQRYGMMELYHGRVVQLVEKPQVFASDIRVLGIYALPYWFLDDLARFQGEYSLEESLRAVINKYDGIRGMVLPEEMSFPSLKFPWDLLAMNQYLMNRWNLKGLVVGEGADIHPSALVFGPAIIRPGVKILEGAVVKGPCFIDEGATIGTHALVRDYAYIGRGVVVGAFSEVKNSLLYEGVSLHGNFVGDSILDRGVHLGAGTKTANTKLKNAGHKHVRSAIKGAMTNTWRTKLGMIVGADSSLGINGSIFPGVKIGQRVQVWPGTIVDTDIPDGFLCRPANTNVLVSRRSS